MSAVHTCVLWASFAARFSRVQFSVSTLCFRKTKQTVSKCTFSILMNLFPTTPWVLDGVAGSRLLQPSCGAGPPPAQRAIAD